MINTPEKKPHLWIKDITEKDTVSDHYLVKEKRLADKTLVLIDVLRASTTRRNTPFRRTITMPEQWSQPTMPRSS